MKKWILIVFFFLVLIARSGLSQENQNSGQGADDLARDREAMEKEKAAIKRQWDDLKSFQIELEQRAAELEKEKKLLDEKRELFRLQLENESVNKKVIESYESIDPEQAAPLLISLFKENEDLAVLLMRKMTPKKSGKIMEAMIPLDRELSTRLTQRTLTYHTEKK